MKSLLNMAVLAMAVGFYLVYHYGINQAVQPTSAAVLAPLSSDALSALHPPAAKRPREKEQALMFGGYPCGDDCSEHNAGYRWGRENGINEPDNCDGNTGRFIEGCRVYAEERRTELRSRS